MKKISFIIPMYNAGSYIGDCINSILSQNLAKEDFEIIVVDDGSVDKGKDVVLSFDNIKYFYQENKGQAAARNVGLTKAEGEYIWFVDADDMLVPNSIDLVLYKAIEYDLEMVTFNVVSKEEQVVNGDSLSEIITGVQYLERNNYPNGPCWYIVKRKCLDELRFVEGRYVEDAMFTMELLIRVKSIAHIDRCCYFYVIHEGSTQTRKDESHMKKMIADYLFVFHHMQGLIKRYRSSLSDKAVTRCEQRSESFLFFLLVRLLRFVSGRTFIKETISTMRAEGAYPIKRLNKEDYPGFKFVLIHFIVNHPLLLICANRICRLLRK